MKTNLKLFRSEVYIWPNRPDLGKEVIFYTGICPPALSKESWVEVPRENNLEYIEYVKKKNASLGPIEKSECVDLSFVKEQGPLYRQRFEKLCKLVAPIKIKYKKRNGEILNNPFKNIPQESHLFNLPSTFFETCINLYGPKKVNKWLEPYLESCDTNQFFVSEKREYFIEGVKNEH